MATEDQPADFGERNDTSERSGFWNRRFSEPGYAYGDRPNDFLQATCAQMVPGDVLSLCEGEGRNAVYLARLGFKVTAVDFSEVGLAKARDLATERGVSIATIAADLAEFDMGAARWDLVIAIFAQPPSAVRQRLYGQMSRALRPGGCFVLESKVDINATAAGRYPGVEILGRELAPLKIALARVQERQLNEGPYHAGMQCTGQIVAFNS